MQKKTHTDEQISYAIFKMGKTNLSCHAIVLFMTAFEYFIDELGG